MRKNYNKILQGISVADVQIDNFDEDTSTAPDKKTANETTETNPLTTEVKKVVNSENTTSKVVAKKRGKKKKEELTTKASGRRFRGKNYASTRIRKDLMALLKLLFDEMTSVEIMDFIAIQYLEKNQKLLTQKVVGVKLKQ